ncbi:Helix-turn-helix domain protein [Planctomycetes bacterium Pan216]|uniref:Helix-turn-helix domain protein n=1 Tax=Kolteria novifilia TaxID=2527975 RepID=A0A518B3B7_9BACT|nr:Helix-turn-helix domain protein [Planctomycetes bacterium Pan216]
MTEPNYVSTTRVSKALGVSVSTVKRWVDDGILPAHKTAGGHRKVLVADVLRLVRDGEFPHLDLGCLEVRPARSDASDLADRLYNALLKGNIEQVNAVIQGSYQQGMPIAKLGDEIVAPSMHRVGSDWERGALDVYEEHRATQLCASSLFSLRSSLEAHAAKDRPTALGGAIEGDQSLLPSLLCEMVLLDEGWKAINLGPETPIESFLQATCELKPTLVWMSVSYQVMPRDFEERYAEFYAEAEKQGVAVVIGGQRADEQLLRRLPHTSSGLTLTQLVSFARWINPRKRRPRRGRPPLDSSGSASER